MNNDVNAQIEAEIQVYNLGEAIKKIRTAFPLNTDFIGVSGQWTGMEDNYRGGGMTQEAYNVETVRLRKNLLHFIKKQSQENRQKLLSALMNPGQDRQGGVIVQDGERGVIKIAYIESTPKGVPPLQTGLEYRQLEDAVRRGTYSNNYDLRPIVLSATMGDVIKTLLSVTPDILHFSGHSGENGIIVVGENNEYVVLPTERLKSIFNNVYQNSGRNMLLLFLNSCHSEQQAMAISQHAEYAIGMNDYISDNVALVFSKHFYEFLANTSSADVETCFKLAIDVLNNTFGKDSNRPQLWKGGEKGEY